MKFRLDIGNKNRLSCLPGCIITKGGSAVHYHVTGQAALGYGRCPSRTSLSQCIDFSEVFICCVRH
ncbi:hypothetical protein RV134_390083 [Roseovarius sp. EC-HK134]|nr:hypothetical protein RV420_460154 [Roseovarius sp. EC-SD190]VVT33476.1 hypothetical protein RV134_390083 [Roseovarius sp. EC-HK134]